ncbi:MAG: aminoacyl-tRNA hydrolase [Syntrophales bacterium]|nr:aminoacyl-tRNA hydrolase [Syntrophales bacterium]
MKIIVGLGNPGKKYTFTRHNVGFMVIDKLAEENGISISKVGFDALYGKGSIKGNEVLLVKPQTYMNLSGKAVAKIVNRYKINKPEDLIVVHDDLDLPFATLRLKFGGGHGGHKGLQSIIEHIGDSSFIRVRLGIGKSPLKSITDKYVLSPFSHEEMQMLPAVIQKASEAIVYTISLGIQAAMNKFHKRTINQNRGG